jgi:hypothetical protein
VDIYIATAVVEYFLRAEVFKGEALKSAISI